MNATPAEMMKELTEILILRIRRFLSTMRSNKSVTASKINFVDEVCLPRLVVPWADLGTERP